MLAELLLAAVLFVLVGMAARPAQRALPMPAGGVISAQSPLPPGCGLRAASCSERITPLVLGVLLGSILITKTTAYVAAPLALGVLVWRWLEDHASLRRVLLEGLSVLLPAVSIAVPWYARNIAIYGWPDFLGLIRHDQIVTGQMRTVQVYRRERLERLLGRVRGRVDVQEASQVCSAGWACGWTAATMCWACGWACPPRSGPGREAVEAAGAGVGMFSQRLSKPGAIVLALSALLTLLAYV